MDSTSLTVTSTTMADLVDRSQVMDLRIRALWDPAPPLHGPAFIVRCAPGDNLMMHAAIYQAAPGDVIVVEAGDHNYAVAGGNVCAVAQRRGVAGLVVDGVIRDVGEARAASFPVYAVGTCPKPGIKSGFVPTPDAVLVGGVRVHQGDYVVADEDGIVVLPGGQAADLLRQGALKQSQEADQSLDQWEDAHRAKIHAALVAAGQPGLVGLR